ncbi:MAG: hypothetical protein JOY90_35260 [Bradyrhizobium sp.]|uniref:HAAS signaling domain-containing protein n=1 Tax=Bradyrhizobium sp. TaxID=376 RepID=UPI001D59BD14|nr:hypothetical protein [Bradyrhizobium sp.]MBV9565674.1 hypothetical protein [Bradyrhizobium sp.]
MRQHEPIADYAGALTRQLGFDAALARRVRAEIEDHLFEAADELGGPSPDNQRSAIARFGDADELARHLLADCLLARAQRVGLLCALAVIGLFAAMEIRLAWYGFMRWESGATLQALSAVALPIDRYAFFVAIGFALAGFCHLATQRMPADLPSRHRRQLNCGLALCAAAVGALLAAVIVESVLTGIRLAAMPFSVAIVIPVLSLLAEIVMVAAVAFGIATTVQTTMAASALARR